MNVQPINPPRPAVRATCLKCRKYGRVTFADLDGPPFAAFYCDRCGKVERAEQERAQMIQEAHPD